MLTFLGLGIAGLGAGVSHWGHVRNDAVRHETSAEVELLMMPSAEALRVGSLGYAVHLADLLWVRSLLTFGERFAREPDPAWQAWLAKMLDAVTTLDPHWRTPYFYGGVMLRITGDYDGSTALFTKGHEALPEDHFFPFAVGINHYLGKEDAEQAAHWVRIAASLPGAPTWYASAAQGFIVNTSNRDVAIRYLREELAETSDPELREPLEAKLRLLMHEHMVEKFEELASLYEEAHGVPPASPEALLGTGGMQRMPPDPLEGSWVIDVDGAIRSSVDVEDRIRRGVNRERDMLTSFRAPN